MKLIATALPGVVTIEPRVFEDARGSFFEAGRVDGFTAAGLPAFVQDNQSRSVPGTLRGLHYQLDMPQGKLVRVVRGAVFDVAVDIRVGSPGFGQWVGMELSEDNRRMVFVPPGFAHGFCVLGDEPADVLYRCTDYYSGAADQRGVAWNDASIGVAWPIAQPLLSDKDRTYLPLRDPGRADLPVFTPDGTETRPR